MRCVALGMVWYDMGMGMGSEWACGRGWVFVERKRGGWEVGVIRGIGARKRRMYHASSGEGKGRAKTGRGIGRRSVR